MSKEERIKMIVELLREADEKQMERLHYSIKVFLRAGSEVMPFMKEEGTKRNP